MCGDDASYVHFGAPEGNYLNRELRHLSGRGTKICVLIRSSTGVFKRYNQGSVVQKVNLDQNDLCFAIQDQVIQFTFVMFFQSNIGLDHPLSAKIRRADIFGGPISEPRLDYVI